MADADALPKFVLTGPGDSSITVFAFGSHVTSWKSSTGEEQLFLSNKAVFKPPKAIRGGVPVCFPQFGTLGPLGQHGFARNESFTVISTAEDTAILQLEPSKEDLEKFPHPFKLTVTVQVGDNSLFQQLHVENTGSAKLAFTTALHTYLRVSSISSVRVEGLKGLKYFDNVDGADFKTEESEAVHINGETDRVYRQAPETVTVVDGTKKVVLTKKGFPDVVLWNPWVEKARGMSDFADQEYQEMVCLEPAVAKSGPVELEPGATWAASQTLEVSKL